ncbi:Coiled-coil-helix-coiled-coil-helix domain-containing protein 7 [Dispira simplex]|nr:Coiled-coil-helix-coiled-coil-helix domain-containing protein 7 [Dispira simplex]
MYLNPCEIESQASLACLERNPNNKKACQKYFDTYKECKREWTRSHREYKSKQRTTTNTPKPE